MAMSTLSEAVPSHRADSSCPEPLRVLLWAAWFGIVSGILELAIFLLKCHFFDARNYNVSRHFPWMYPVSGLIVVGAAGMLLALAVLLRPNHVSRSAILGILSFFAYLGLLFRLPIYTAACLILAACLAIRTGGFLAARADAYHRLVGWSLKVLAGLLIATVFTCYGREIRAEHRAQARPLENHSGAKNVILIVLDTVRAQSLSLYGYPRDTTPNLRKLGAKGVRFDRAFATAPWTAPSHASMFTGRWSHEMSVGWNQPLDKTTPTLAEFLGEHGYGTAGFVANTTYCSYETGLDRGFVHYEDYDVTPRAILLCSALVQRALNFVQTHPNVARWLDGAVSDTTHRKSAARINADFLGWVNHHRDRPFFAFLNYFDAHHPYLLPELADAPAFGRRPETYSEVRTLKTWWDLDKRKIGARDVELAIDSYDRCITYLDHQIGRLFEELERRELLRDTLVVITADHGEHLGEQALFGHGCSLYLSELHVPLLIIAPGNVPEKRVIAEPVSLRDLPATIVDRLGLQERSPFPGHTLSRTWSRDPGLSLASTKPILSELNSPPEADPNHGESPACLGPMTSLVDENYHYIRNGQGREELFELQGDSDELHNLAGSPEVATVLKRFRGSLKR